MLKIKKLKKLKHAGGAYEVVHGDEVNIITITNLVSSHHCHRHKHIIQTASNRELCVSAGLCSF